MAGQRDVTALADVARRQLRTNRAQLAEALEGYFTPHHSCLLTEYLSQLDSLEEAINRVSMMIARHVEAAQEAMALLDTSPGVSQRTAETLLADIGTDTTRFPRGKPLASWAGMCPGHHESAGKRLSGKTRKGRRRLRQVRVKAAHVAAKTDRCQRGCIAMFAAVFASTPAGRALVAVDQRTPRPSALARSRRTASGTGTPVPDAAS